MPCSSRFTSGSPTTIRVRRRAPSGPASINDVPMYGRRRPRVTWIGSSTSPPPRRQYGVPTRYGRVGAVSTAGVSTTERLGRPRIEYAAMAASFTAM